MKPAALALAALLAAAEVDPPSTDSVYQVTSTWRDQAGKPTKLRAFEGSVVVLGMIYTSCQGACPMLVNDMQRIERQVKGLKGAKVRFVLASFDPERDTPERLAQYAKAHGLDGWTLLTSDPDSVRELAAVLGMRYRQLPGGDFAHSNLITVLDPKGTIAHRQIGLAVDPSETVTTIISLLRR